MIYRLLMALSLSVVASAVNAAILNVSPSGVLTGANGVDIAGEAFKVEFVTGSCDSLFNNCDPGEFAFSTLGQAEVAAEALLGQVLVDSPLGNFDSQTDKIFDCFFANNCLTRIPFASSNAMVSQVVVTNLPGNLRDSFFNETLGSDSNSAMYSNVNFAKFTPVPEPSTFTLTLPGLFACGWRRRGHRGTSVT